MISRNEYGKPINKGRFFFCSECISAYALLIFIPAFIYSCSDSGMDSHDYANHAFTEIRIAGASAYAADRPEGNTVDIFIYDDDKAGRLDTYQRAVLSHDLMVEAASRTGDKVMAVIVNPQNDGYEWDEISSYEALMNIYADLTPYSMFTPYVMAGIGMTNIEYEFQGFGRRAVKYEEDNFTWAVGGGLSAKLTNRINIDVGYRFWHMGEIEKASVRAHEVYGGFRYVF